VEAELQARYLAGELIKLEVYMVSGGQVLSFGRCDMSEKILIAPAGRDCFGIRRDPDGCGHARDQLHRSYSPDQVGMVH